VVLQWHQKVADRVVDKLADYSPNLKSSMIGRRLESPAELGERLIFNEKLMSLRN
jgi:phytoene dehydrogenase-like protein